MAVSVLVILGAGYLVWDSVDSSEAEEAFLALAAEGRGELPTIDRDPNLGNRHLDPGQDFDYGKRFPTSGPHALTPTRPGIYDDIQPPIEVVHALEHGHIVIYRDRPGEAVEEILSGWSSLYGGLWDGVVVVPSPGLGERIVMTAWRHRLDLANFDAKIAAAFIDRFRGRGPENPVR
ncbi:MAG: DUF3105 domain-containing protein [Kiloniellales bacterium]|nr:DUF3105 domain-containing protein [Kiloniellales bacterium]